MSEPKLNLVGGEWVAGELAPNINPSDTSDIAGYYARANAARAQEAIQAAKAAFPGWSRSTPLERHAVLRAASDEILARRDELGRLLSCEDGKTLAEGIGETVRAAQISDFFAGEALRLSGEALPSIRPGVGVEITREAMGPVATVIAVKDYEEALAVAHDTEFGLSAGIATTSLKHATHYKRNSEAGMVMVNLPTAGGDFHVPFGGRKASSLGPREQGRYAAEFHTTLKIAYTLA